MINATSQLRIKMRLKPLEDKQNQKANKDKPAVFPDRFLSPFTALKNTQVSSLHFIQMNIPLLL